MKKSLTLGVLTLSTLALVACSKSNSTQEIKTSSENTSQSLETSSSSSEKVDDKQYDELLNNLNSELNPSGSSDFTAKVENNVKDSDFPEGHTIINITITGETKKSLAEMMEAINSNTATADQKNGINLFRMVISQMAKELPDDTTTINVGYEISANQTQLIAKSSKLQDFIPTDNLVLE